MSFKMGALVLCEFLILLVTISFSQGARIDFYEHADFRGRILRVSVDSKCRNLPEKWSHQISSVQSWGCGKFYMDTECKDESIRINNEDIKDLGEIWTAPKRSHRYWRNKHWNDKIMSFGPCNDKSDKEKLRDVATRYLEEVYKRTISVNQLRKIGKDMTYHIYNPNTRHHRHE